MLSVGGMFRLLFLWLMLVDAAPNSVAMVGTSRHKHHHHHHHQQHHKQQHYYFIIISTIIGIFSIITIIITTCNLERKGSFSHIHHRI